MKLLSKKMARLIFGFFAFAETGEYEDGQRDRDDREEDISFHFRVQHHFSPFTVLLMEVFEESQLYYTTPQANNQAENAGDCQHMLKSSGTIIGFGGGLLLLLPLNNPQKRKSFQFFGIQLRFGANCFFERVYIINS